MKVTNLALGLVLCVVATGANITVRAAAGKDEVKRVGAATTVVNEMMGARDKAIPGAILEKAEAIAIFPGVKKAGSSSAANGDAASSASVTRTHASGPRRPS